MNSLDINVSKTEATIINLNTHRSDNQLPKVKNAINVFENGVHKIVFIHDIILIKGESNYSNIILENGRSIFTSRTIKHWTNEINNSKLLRVHKSYLINVEKIREVNKRSNQILLTENHLVRCSRMVKKYVLNLVN
ncbi:MAG: LytTR family DNA-binding domain-containing protein [Saprospiraceae bacterium]